MTAEMASRTVERPVLETTSNWSARAAVPNWPASEEPVAVSATLYSTSMVVMLARLSRKYEACVENARSARSIAVILVPRSSQNTSPAAERTLASALMSATTVNALEKPGGSAS